MSRTLKSNPTIANPSGLPEANRPQTRKKTTQSQPNSDEFVQDRVTLFAFYALFAAIAAGLLYFISLIFFI
jgi:hypothetical protein